MRKVGIHLEDVAVVLLQCPFESSDVGSSQTQFSTALYEVQFSREISAHQSFHDARRAVGRAIINHEDMESLFEREHGTNDFLDILFLVVGRNDNYAITLFHGVVELSD